MGFIYGLVSIIYLGIFMYMENTDCDSEWISLKTVCFMSSLIFLTLCIISIFKLII
jgi:hypothetical protein